MSNKADISSLSIYALSSDLSSYALLNDVSTSLSNISVNLSIDYLEKINDLKTTTTELIETVSAEAIISANAYTNE